MKKSVMQFHKDNLQRACVEMRATDWFERYVNHAKGQGCTIALVQACKHSAATLVTFDAKTADMIASTHKIKCTHILDEAFAANPVRSVVDNFAIHELFKEGKRVQALGEALLAFLKLKGVN